jgi:hypothetical protein
MMEQKFEAEEKKRRRKEEDLVSAEERIEQLEFTIRQLEELGERDPKRPLPSRNKGDSPEQHAEKKICSTDEDLTQTSKASVIPSPVIPPPITPVEKASSVPVKKAAEPEIQKASTVPVKKAAEPEIQVSSSAPVKQEVIPKSSKTTPEVEEILSSDESSGSSSSSSGKGSSVSCSKDSVASIPTWAPDPRDSTTHHYLESASGKDNHYRVKVTVPPSQVRRRTDGLYNDEEKGRLTLEAWRARLRNKHEYAPDRDYSKENHLTKIKILQSALTNWKRDTWRLSRQEQLEYRHEHYQHLSQVYSIPADLCSVAELYEKMKDGSQLERYRCVPVCHYYRMLMEDTPGFTRTQTPDESRASSSRPHYNSSRSRSGDTSTSASNRRHARSIDEMSREDKERIAELKRKQILVKQGRAPEAYERERRKALNRAEQERKQGKSTPDYLEGIEPPFNDERQEILDLYDEMMVQDFEESIACIETASAANRAMEEAESSRKSKGGPGGQGRR